MPTAKLPLVGSFNQRGLSAASALDMAQDQRFLNCTFTVVQNSVTGKATLYVEKRPGWGVDSTVSSGIASTGLIQPQAFPAPLSAFGTTSSNIYVGTINVGVISARALHLTETLISASSYVLLKASDGTGWYYPQDAKDVLTYTGHTSSESATISTIASVAGIYPGQLITGNTIAAGARVSTVIASTSTITLTITSSATSSSVLLTKEPIAKILSTVFTTSEQYHSALVPMDGYHFYTTDNGRLYNSDLNSITAYTATNFVSPDQTPDKPVAVGTHKNAVIAWGTGSMEVYQNAGNATGSPLQRIPQYFANIGALDQRSIAKLGDDIYFVTGARFGDVAVMRLRGLVPQPVSPPEMNKILGTISAGGQIYLSAFQMGGYSYVAATALTTTEETNLLLLESGDHLLLESDDEIIIDGSGAETAMFGRQLVLNADLRLWSEWDCDQATYIVGVGSGATNKILATSRTDTGGKIFTISPASDGELHTDDGTAFSMEIRTAKIDFGTDKKKYINSVRLIADERDSGTVTLECSDDDYASWVTLGTFDMTSKDKRITRCGAHRGGRAYRLTDSANQPFRGERLEIDYTVGLS